MGTVKQYDPQNYVCTVDSTDIGGWADGSIIAIEFDSDGVGDEAGAHGDVVRMIMHDDRATATLRLQATSDSNTFLSGLYEEDRLTKAKTFSFMLYNIETGEKAFAAEAWVMRAPTPNVEGTELPVREWRIRLAKCKIAIRGAEVI